jgi:drug/metabolite transporter (DMT)-like permease
MLAGAVMISTAAPLVRAAEAPTLTAAFYRMVVGTIALFLIAKLRGETLSSDWRHVVRALPAGVFFTFDLYLWHESILLVGPGLATILVNLQVLILGAAGFLVFKERVTWRFYAGIAFILPGVWMLVGLGSGASSETFGRGVIYGLMAAAAYAGFVLSMRVTQSAEDGPAPSVNLAFASMWTGVGSVVLAMLTGEWSFWVISSPKVALLLLAYGVVCQSIGWLLITRASPQLPAALVGLFLLVQPALAFVWDVAFFDRATSWFDVVGILLVLLGVFMASFRKAPA